MEVTCNPTPRWALANPRTPHCTALISTSSHGPPVTGPAALLRAHGHYSVPRLPLYSLTRFFSSKSSCKTAPCFQARSWVPCFGHKETPAQLTAAPSRAGSVTSQWTEVPGHPHGSVRNSALKRGFAINKLQLKFFRKAFIASFHFLYD